MKDKTTKAMDEAVEPSNLFQNLLAKHRKGIAGNKASSKLREALLASRDTGAKSTVTITVTLIPGSDDQMKIEIQATNKLPDDKLPGGQFWVGEDGELLTSDPAQKEFAFREVAKDASQPRESAAKQA